MLEVFIKKFNELSIEEMYEILKLRVNIFVVEQKCPYEELDGKDDKCIHLFYKENDEIAAYLRIIPKGLSFDSVSIGRVCVKQEYRKQKLGRKIMEEAINYTENTLKEYKITVGAQEYLKDFYASFDFEKTSETYLEDDIPHLDMKREKLCNEDK